MITYLKKSHSIILFINFFKFFSLFALQGESSYPYLSGYTWLSFCDWVLVNDDYANKKQFFNPELVKQGDTIFLDLTCLELFTSEYLPKIQHKIILISTNYGYLADNSLPGQFDYLLEEEKIAAWFVQNIDRAPTSKLIPIPIGIASSYWPHGNTKLLD